MRNSLMTDDVLVMSLNIILAVAKAPPKKFPPPINYGQPPQEQPGLRENRASFSSLGTII